MSSTGSFYDTKPSMSDKPSTDLETADSQIDEKATVADDNDSLDYNHEHEDEEYHAPSRGLTVVFKVRGRPSEKLEPWTGRTCQVRELALSTTDCLIWSRNWSM